MSKIKLILVTILVAGLMGLTIYHNQTKERVLIIHSYNTDFPWVLQINGGIQQYLNDHPSNVVIRYQYMDLKNHKSCDFYRSAANDARLIIQNWQPQVIIIMDDLGQSLVGVNYLHFKSNIDTSEFYNDFAGMDAIAGGCDLDASKNNKRFFGLDHLASKSYQPIIIFGGVNGDVERYHYDAADNVTGVFEHKNANAIRQTIADLYQAIPDGQKPTGIQVLSDRSGSASSERNFFVTQLPKGGTLNAPLDWQPYEDAKGFGVWQQIVIQANRHNSMLLIANYTQIFKTDGDIKAMDTKEVITWTVKNAKYPVLGAATNFISDGGALTLAVPGYQQGQEATRMALKVLSLNTPIPLPISDPELQPVDGNRLQFVVGMNANLLSQQGINLPLIYEAFSRESNNFKEK